VFLTLQCAGLRYVKKGGPKYERGRGPGKWPHKFLGKEINWTQLALLKWNSDKYVGGDGQTDK
jgi:hypothetical protein